MHIERSSDDARYLQSVALRLAQQCRAVIQGCLFEWEWEDCDEEFAAIISAGLKEYGHRTDFEN
ncbi:MAG: hypothetical protein JSS02_06380 [Planctomycetes bacterium]|nr:hypothetical protein [Planctomycetota bacterium]